MKTDYFPLKPDSNPQIYAYSENRPDYKGLLKIGYTTIDVGKRVAQQYPVLGPIDKPYTIVLSKLAMRNDGSTFTDHDIHRHLKERNFHNPGGEWFECTVKDVEAAIISVC